MRGFLAVVATFEAGVGIYAFCDVQVEFIVILARLLVLLVIAVLIALSRLEEILP